MNDLNASRVIIFAKNMEEMTSFYENVLGLSCVKTSDDTDTFVSFDAGGIQVSLHAIPADYARHIEISVPPTARANTPLKLVFHVDDVEATRTVLNSRGANMKAVQKFGKLHLCDGLDPEGNIFQISNRP